jgi:hypothetical protein
MREDKMVKIVKRHKVTGEIVKVDAKREWIGLDGIIPAHILGKIKAATETGSDYLVLGQEGVYTPEPYVMTAKDKELEDYCNSRTRIERAMHE